MKQALTSTLHEIVWLMDQKADQLLKRDFGISFSWFHLMLTLQSVQPSTQHHLAVCLNYSDPAVSKLLVPIHQAGYVSIHPDPEHGRRRIVRLTPAGEKLTSSADTLLTREFGRVLRDADINLTAYTTMSTTIVETLRKDKS